MNAYSIPSADSQEFSRLPDKVKDEVVAWLAILNAVESAPRALAEIENQTRAHAGRRGFSRANIRRKYYAWKAEHDWRVLINHAALPNDEVRKLPAAFVEFWKTFAERNQRKSRPAWRRMIAFWRAGNPIPGYPAPEQGKVSPPADLHGVPAGWGYRNLMRYQPARHELTLARIGRSAAAPFRPLVFSTRVGLKPGQYLVFDDLEHQLKVNFLGVNTRAMRPLELACLDLFSGCKIAWGMKPTIDDNGAKQKLKEREMRFLLAYILTRIGYRAEGTTLCVEHGTAAIRPDIERILLDATDGAVTVARSGIEGAAALVYEGRGKGNFRFKSYLESHHNLTQNELAHLPGQMGMDRDHSPEELHGRERHNNALMKALKYLPADRAALIDFPFLEFGVFMDLAAQAYQVINNRDWHDLEGFQEAHLVKHEFRLGMDLPWLPAAQLAAAPEHERAAIHALIAQPGYTRIRKMSPQEVWDSGKSELIRLPGHIAPLIIGTDNAAERRVGDNGLIEFQDRNLGPGTFRYLAQCRTPEGDLIRLPEGDRVLAFCNPFDASVLHVCRAGASAGAYIGECARWESVRRDDVEALHRQMGAAAKAEYELLRPYQARHTAEMRARTAAAKNNAGILAGARVTARERQVDAAVECVQVGAADRRAALGNEREEEDQETFSPDEIAGILQTDQ